MFTFTAPDWRQHSACRDVDPDIFHGPADSPDGHPLYAWEKAALTVCARCPVAPACLAEALTYPAGEQYGVVGGLTASQRRRLPCHTNRHHKAAA